MRFEKNHSSIRVKPPEAARWEFRSRRSIEYNEPDWLDHRHRTISTLKCEGNVSALQQNISSSNRKLYKTLQG